MNETGNVNGADQMFGIGLSPKLSGPPDPTPVNIHDDYITAPVFWTSIWTITFPAMTWLTSS